MGRFAKRMVKEIKRVREAYRNSIPPPDGECSRESLSARDRILENLYVEGFRVGEISESMKGIKQSQLSGSFPLCCGMKMNAFLNFHRVHCCIKLMEEVQGINWTMAARSVGYNNYSTFSRALNKIYDQSPKFWWKEKTTATT